MTAIPKAANANERDRILTMLMIRRTARGKERKRRKEKWLVGGEGATLQTQPILISSVFRLVGPIE